MFLRVKFNLGTRPFLEAHSCELTYQYTPINFLS